MPFINTNDNYVKEYCKTHPEADLYLNELIELKNKQLLKYGIPEKGGLGELSYDVNSQDWFKDVKSVQIDLLKELKRVCDENGLKVFLIYGSLLGAVRSGGMIAGDDDIDVALLREDYDKLVKMTDSFKRPYFLQNNYNDDCFYGGYIKLRNANTTAINPQNWYANCCEGIFIDIFPIDKGYTSSIKEHFKLKKIHHLQRLLYAKSYGFFRSFKDMSLLVWKFYKYAGKIIPRQKLLEKLDAVLKENDTNASNKLKNKLGIYSHYSENCMPRYLPADAFEDICRMEYEGIEFYAPKLWDDVLFKLYGARYLTPSNGNDEFHAFYKADVPYSNYKRRFTRLFTSIPDKNKKILIVGDAELYCEYLKRFPSSAYKPYKFIHKAKYDELNSFNKDEIFLVVAAFDFLDIEAKIRNLGYRNYCIYVYNREWLLLPNINFSNKLYHIEKSQEN